MQRGGVTANQNSDDLIAELKKGLGGGQGLRPVRARKVRLRLDGLDVCCP